MTYKEKIILQHIQPKHKWIIENENKEFFVCMFKPTKNEIIWFDKYYPNDNPSTFWRLLEERKRKDEELSLINIYSVKGE